MDHQSPNVPDSTPGPDPDPAFYQRALRRMPRWIALVTALALPFTWWHGGSLWAASFLVGAIGGYWNYVAVCRVADRLSRTVQQTGRGPRSNPRPFLRLLFIAVAAFVIIRFTRINLAAAFLGLFTPVAAVMVEILFELANHE
jgi:hypothetical protein